MTPVQTVHVGGAPDLHPIVTEAEIRFVIGEVAKANGLEQFTDALVRQCKQESAFRITARNVKSDCYGLFQLAAATAEEFKVNRLDWRDNIVGGIKFMAWLLRYFHNDYHKAVAGFNWGPGNLNKCVAKYASDWIKHLPQETAHYLEVILPVLK